MALRKASAYSRKMARPFTRNSRSKARAYIKTVPGVKIAKYVGGMQKDFESGKHPFAIRLITGTQRIQIRDNAIEAARMFVIKMLEENAPGQYFLVVKVHPHHMQRENKSAGGMAGADRISSGMTQSYGQVIGRAALVKPGQEIFFISCANDKAARIARDALIDVKPKIPGGTRVVFEQIRK
jgi:large subunit ribosomal protein L10e